ncbi:MAG: hypothetical protein ABI551_07635 [Polyangiaceae bacterium]
MTTRKRNALILAAILVASVGAFVFTTLSQPGSTRGTTLDAIPADAFLVATVDVSALRDSPLAAPLAPFVAQLGADEVSKRCGFEPITRVRELSFAIPEGQDGEFGILARADVTRAEMTACTKAVIAGRGGSPLEAKSSSFSLVSDDTSLLSSPSKIAFDDHGLILVGRGGWLDEMIAASKNERPRLESNAAHAELRAALGQGRLAVLTATLPAALRKKIERELEGDAQGANELMKGVLGVGAAGLALGTTGTVTELAAEIRCDSPEDCTAVERLFEKKKKEWSANLGMRFLGVGALVDSLTVKVEGKELHATAHLPTEDAERLVERLVDLRLGSSVKGASVDAGAPLPTPSAALSPSEVLSAKSSGTGVKGGAGLDASLLHRQPGPPSVTRPGDAGPE